MKKSDLVDALAAHTGMTKTDSGKAVDALFGTGGIIAGAMKKGDSVQITGFGTFEVRNRPARTGRNPKTKATITIAASKAPAFRAGKGLKDSLQ